jgi:hypothetical protein
MKVQKGRRGVTLLFLYPRRYMALGEQKHARQLYPQERDPVPVVQEAECAPGSVWTGVEDLTLAGIRSLDRPASSKSLYRLQ